MKRKSVKLKQFIDGLYKHIVTDPSFRKKTKGKSEAQIQTEIRPLILGYLTKWFKDNGVVNYENKAHKSFYWEGQESRHNGASREVFASYNYPDFIIREPYNIAIEYKQSPNGSTVKQGIGQSLMLTMSGEYDYVLYLFHDQSPQKKINESVKSGNETKILKSLWDDFNIKLYVV